MSNIEEKYAKLSNLRIVKNWIKQHFFQKDDVDEVLEQDYDLIELKTINGQSILGSGNINIEGGSNVAKPFVVTFSLNEAPSSPSSLFLCDKTSEDIIAAHNAGKEIWFVAALEDSFVSTIQKEYSYQGDTVLVRIKYPISGSLMVPFIVSINGTSVHSTIENNTTLYYNYGASLLNDISEVSIGMFGNPTYTQYTISDDANISMAITCTQPCYMLITNNTSSDCDITISGAVYADIYALLTQEFQQINNMVLPEDGITIPANSSVELSVIYDNENNVVVLTYSTKLTKITLNE